MKLYQIDTKTIINLDLVEYIEFKIKLNKVIFYTPSGTQEMFFSGTSEDLMEVLDNAYHS